jgi:hypothetical protein
MRKRLGQMNYSMSLFLIYFGTRRKYPNLLHHNIIFGPRYRELLKDIFSRGRLADDFSLYLHAPSRSDADLAPEGCETFYVLSPVPHWARRDWHTEGPLCRAHSRLAERHSCRFAPADRRQNFHAAISKSTNAHGLAFSRTAPFQRVFPRPIAIEICAGLLCRRKYTSRRRYTGW